LTLLSGFSHIIVRTYPSPPSSSYHLHLNSQHGQKYIGPTPDDLSSILSARNCETCRQSTLPKPTIVHSVKGDPPSHICDGRDIPREWALNSVLHFTAWRDRPLLPYTQFDGQIVASFAPVEQSVIDACHLNQIERSLAKLSLAKTGRCFDPYVSEKISQFVPSEPTFAEACLSAVDQVSNLALEPPPGLELDNGPSIPKLTQPEVYHIANYIESRPETASCRSYLSILEKTRVTTQAERFAAVSDAIRDADLDPRDFAPRESAFRGNAPEALADITCGTGKPFTGV